MSEAAAAAAGAAEKSADIIFSAGQNAHGVSEKLAELRADLKKTFSDVTFKWSAWAVEDTAWRTYFVSIDYQKNKSRNAGRWGVCLLCKETKKLKSSSNNGQKHLVLKHQNPQEPFHLHPLAGHSNAIATHFERMRAADERSEEERQGALARSRWSGSTKHQLSTATSS